MLNVSKPAAYTILACSIVCEIIGSACLEACNGFENKKLTILLIICYFVAFSLFSKILHIIDLAVGYATWTALGAIACAVLGVVLFDQHLTITGWVSIIIMAIGVFLLNLFGTPKEENEEKMEETEGWQ
ncbi:MAG: multidrug efflux SMR transporter [Firmicutes bacterium]|nr:multidrug efflux SMR transporter [Bacillota bacterium]